jgi:hypothetical protein
VDLAVKPTDSGEANVYIVGRPLMFVLWVVTLWGTGTGVRLLWLFLTDEARAFRLAGLPTVWVPIVLGTLMWIALLAAIRHHRRHGER